MLADESTKFAPFFRSPGPSALLALFLLAVGGCDGCGCGGAPSGLVARGDVTYVQCSLADPPEDRIVEHRGWTYTLEDGVLTLEGEEELRGLSASGIGVPITAETLADAEPPVDAVALEETDVLFFFGGIGDVSEAADQTLSALSDLDRPVILLAGGRDEYEVWHDAIDSVESELVFDATALLAIFVLGQTLVPVAGAPLGHYARTEESCGFDSETLEAREGGEATWMLSWAAPSGPLDPGFEGGAAGSDLLRAFMTQHGALGGLFAWPRAGVGLGTDHERVVPTLGAAAEDRDGALIPSGFASFRISHSGLMFP